jgi:hypothetical protein
MARFVIPMPGPIASVAAFKQPPGLFSGDIRDWIDVNPFS